MCVMTQGSCLTKALTHHGPPLGPGRSLRLVATEQQASRCAEAQQAKADQHQSAANTLSVTLISKRQWSRLVLQLAARACQAQPAQKPQK
jgi:hypothetical protein